MLANAAAFVVAGSATGPTFRALALVPAEVAQRPWAVLTYAFLHASAWQLMLDMAALVLIAPRLESRGGGVALIGWYLGGALLAAPLGLLAPGEAFAGSSAAVLAVLVGFARRRPDDAGAGPAPADPAAGPMPAKGRWLVPVLLGAALLPDIATGPASPVTIAHLSLAVLVCVYLVRPVKPAPDRQVEMPNSHFNAPGVTAEAVRTPWDTIDLEALHEVNREAVLVVLEKAHSLGPTHLTGSEREFLDRMCAASRLNRGGGPV